MKNRLLGGWFLTSAVTLACLAGNVGCMHAQPAAPGSEVVLPPDITPGTPLAEVVKLVQVGVDPVVIKTYIANSSSMFNLDAEKIISLTDLGVPSDIVNTMMEHDKNLSGTATVVAPPPATAPVVVEDNAATAAPTAEVDVNYFNDTLSPYGSWVEVEGYGRCWRPTTVIYDAGWQPYCDRGRWVYSDCGWYWDSDYSWGVTFHYGRWFHHDRFGWCWWPDTVWAPSWVTWRQSDAYCGWAPLPPFAVYRPGAGFFYRGERVAAGFDFGIGVDFFTFVPVGHFCDRHPRSFREEPGHVREIFRQTTVINNYNDHQRIVVNGGIPVERINAFTHRELTPVHVGAIRNAEREGWRGPVTAEDRNARNFSSPANRLNPISRDERNNNFNNNNRQTFNPSRPTPNRNEIINSANPSAGHSFNSQGNDHPAAGTQNFHNQSTQAVAPLHSPVSNPSAGHSFNSSGNDHPATGTPSFHNQSSQVVAPVHSTTPENLRPNRNDAVINVPVPERSFPQVEQRQITTPSAPRYTAPPRVESQPPVQNQPKNTGQNSGGSDKDKQNH